jgi:hypothetical protein
LWGLAHERVEVGGHENGRLKWFWADSQRVAGFLAALWLAAQMPESKNQRRALIILLFTVFNRILPQSVGVTST